MLRSDQRGQVAGPAQPPSALVEQLQLLLVMLLDGVVQITERDEFVYQEMLTHVPLLAHGSDRAPTTASSSPAETSQIAAGY